ncbi:MAG TPA: glycosyltransferase [Stellaceae bacterium]|nr:glycosyltransferase [Stellaceae bacterium]
MTRVLQAMAGAAHGGAEAFFERLVAALGRAGEEQAIVIRRNPERAARLRREGVEPVELPFGGIFDFVTRPRLERAISAFRPQIVLTWMSRATALCPRGDFVHVARLGGYYDLRHYRHSDHLIGNTRALTTWLVAEGWPAARVHYLPNFAAEARAAPLPRAAFATPEGAPLALALGRLHRNKGFDLLLDAVARIEGLYLWLAGEGPLESELKRRAASLGVAERVRFLGWREDVPALLAACDVLVSAARVEPLGNTIIEAWASGKPVIAASCSGPAELIENGKNGLLVASEDAVALAAAMRRVIGDRMLAAALAASGRESFEAQFSEARVVAAYRDFFAKVAR